MKRSFKFPCMLAVGVFVLFGLVGGCPPQTVDPNALTQTDLAAIQSALNSISGLGQATGATQNVSGGSSGSGNALFNAGSSGTCPALSLSLSTGGGLEFSVSLDYGTGCPANGSDDYVCSGAVSGSLSQANQTMNMTFDNLSCNDKSLDGTVDATFDITPAEFTLIGTWQLEGVKEGVNFGTAGLGTSVYDRAGHFTTVETFEGTVASDTGVWGCSVTGVVVSYQNNRNLIPSAGTIELAGTDIPDLVIQFDSNSPTTGECQVSRDGGPFMTVNIFEL